MKCRDCFKEIQFTDCTLYFWNHCLLVDVWKDLGPVGGVVHHEADADDEEEHEVKIDTTVEWEHPKWSLENEDRASFQLVFTGPFQQIHFNRPTLRRPKVLTLLLSSSLFIFTQEVSLLELEMGDCKNPLGCHPLGEKLVALNYAWL